MVQLFLKLFFLLVIVVAAIAALLLVLTHFQPPISAANLLWALRIMRFAGLVAIGGPLSVGLVVALIQWLRYQRAAPIKWTSTSKYGRIPFIGGRGPWYAQLFQLFAAIAALDAIFASPTDLWQEGIKWVAAAGSGSVLSSISEVKAVAMMWQDLRVAAVFVLVPTLVLLCKMPAGNSKGR